MYSIGTAREANTETHSLEQAQAKSSVAKQFYSTAINLIPTITHQMGAYLNKIKQFQF